MRNHGIVGTIVLGALIWAAVVWFAVKLIRSF